MSSTKKPKLASIAHDIKVKVINGRTSTTSFNPKDKTVKDPDPKDNTSQSDTSEK
jgi:hypothetical protein